MQSRNLLIAFIIGSVIAIVSVSLYLWLARPGPGQATVQPGAATAQNPNQPQYETQTFDDWAYTCETLGNQRACFALQRLINNDTQQIVLGLVAGYNNAARPILSMRTGLGADAAAGVTLTVGAGAPQVAPFIGCDAARCEAVLELNVETLTRLSNGEEMTVAYVIGGQAVSLKPSSKGFKRAFEMVRPPAPQPR